MWIKTLFIVILGSLFGYTTQSKAQSQDAKVLMIKLNEDAFSPQKGERSVISQLEQELGQNFTRSVSDPMIAGLKKRVALQKRAANQVNAADELRKWFTIQVPENQNPLEFIKKWKNKTGVEHIEPKLMRYTEFRPNDPILLTITYDYYEQQKFYTGWDLEKASEDIVIAIVDSGVDYTNDDLTNKLWTNTGEIPENGIDDDGNGWVDDHIGWDFWEAGSWGETIKQDNDPKGEFSNHGTHVAGIAAAETNNKKGMPGAGFNARFMAIKTGGTKENPRSIGFGYEGILYAVINGADVINCSWGGGGASTYENEVIQSALQAGSIIVAAAGNDGVDGAFYPASYEGVISVGSVESDGSDKISNFSNYGFRLDVLASGRNINSTVFNNSFALNTGTSMASPFVAGLAALVKAHFPDWTPAQVRNQIRTTATNVYDKNGNAYKDRLGGGVINVEKALSEVMPGFIIQSMEITATDGGKPHINQPANLNIILECINPASTSTLIEIEPRTPGISFTGATSQTLSAKQIGDQIELTYNVMIGSNLNLYKESILNIKLSNQTGYSDRLFIFYDKFLYDTHENKIALSLASDGTVGFVDPLNSYGGIGFIPQNEDGKFDENDNVLFSASLVLGHKTKVADKAIATENINTDFKPLEIFSTNPKGDFLSGKGDAELAITADFPKISFKTRSYSSNQTDIDKVIRVNYVLTNKSGAHLDSLYVGYYADFDVLDYSTNSVSYNRDLGLGFIKSAGEQRVAGVAVMNEPGGFLAINNASTETEGLGFGIYYDPDNSTVYNGFTKQEKWRALTSGFQKTSVSSTDISIFQSTGPFSIANGDSISVGFIWTLGNSVEEVQNQIQVAKEKNLFAVSSPLPLSVDEFDAKEYRFEIKKNFPNPFNPTTTLEFETPHVKTIQMRLINILGQTIKKETLQNMSAGIHRLNLDLSAFATGIYFVELKSDWGVQTHKIMLIK